MPIRPTKKLTREGPKTPGKTDEEKSGKADRQVKEKSKGSSIQITGPVQFAWGYSLNKVELVDSYSITTAFSSVEGNKMGSMGKDYRIYYSLIAFFWSDQRETCKIYPPY